MVEGMKSMVGGLGGEEEIAESDKRVQHVKINK